MPAKRPGGKAPERRNSSNEYVTTKQPDRLNCNLRKRRRADLRLKPAEAQDRAGRACAKRKRKGYRTIIATVRMTMQTRPSTTKSFKPNLSQVV